MSYITPMPLNSNTYVIAIDNTSKSATLLATDLVYPSLVIYNGSDKAVFVVTGLTSAPTAVFPTSATVPKVGQVVAPGATVTFGKNPLDQYVAAIQATSGTGNLYISVGPGV